MATKNRKRAVKKAGRKAAKKAAPARSGGAAELKAFRNATQELKAAGSALAKAAKANKQLGSTVGVRTALDRAQNVVASVVKAIPVGPPPTTVRQ